MKTIMAHLVTATLAVALTLFTCIPFFREYIELHGEVARLSIERCAAQEVSRIYYRGFAELVEISDARNSAALPKPRLDPDCR